ncbi:hypothetical protein [Clostridium tarantellae]|uniref:Uncharacterized protein n=1 Tax=Clostridium tarantellae TaxID=39493 RepID=A0A6I1MN76_9CLOT|nr:hypothetical protein [Clostridium tarantellae]MPQ43702.1 hypothetical protein [Clostridium tarantellae]
MINIETLINNDLSKLTMEQQEYITKFNESLRQELIEEIVLNVKNMILNDLKNNKEEFDEFIKEMIVNGYKGLKNINTQGLLNLYLEKKDEFDFMNLIEKVSAKNC